MKNFGSIVHDSTGASRLARTLTVYSPVFEVVPMNFKIRSTDILQQLTNFREKYRHRYFIQFSNVHTYHYE